MPSMMKIENDVLCPHKKGNILKVFTEGITTVFKSKYLISIMAIVGLYEILSTNIDFQFTVVTNEIFSTRDTLASFQGKVFFIAQIISLGIQLLVTPFIHRRCGIMYGLLFLPVALVLGSTAFLVLPLLTVITFCIGSDAAFSYSINQVSKEILYVPLDTISKVKGKAFIDMFVFRGAKALSGAFLLSYTLWLSHHGFDSKFLMVTNIIVGFLWLYAVRVASREFVKHSGCEEN